MSFSFGFTSNDFDDDELVAQAKASIKSTEVNGETPTCINPLDSDFLLQSSVVQPKVENLETILQSLQDVRLTFEEFQSSLHKMPLIRRELFDVKHQLMLEADAESTNNSTELDILLGDTSEDLRKNVYEGGLKSWECSYDLVDLLSEKVDKTITDIDVVLEIGCGTALPSEFLFRSALLRNDKSKGLKFILSDYNASVLRLVTIPNLLITWGKTVLTNEEWCSLQKDECDNIPINSEELLLSPKLLTAFYDDIKSRNITIVLISGSWGRKFSNLIHGMLSGNRKVLSLTSETIYQPDNLPVIAETILDIHGLPHTEIQTYVAAKDIYFGVGGSIVEFEKYLNDKITSENLPIQSQRFEVNSGLKRSIICIESSQIAH
ncbi:hypothetical protein SKDZ_09G0610 [Saccharomyces kudriavzevii ZP591]|uniref:protein-histidine N-methyltransferase n=1 Tax=Saccharomyces cerevisiae x Saccharomyces kudriavzevii (strain VIN7) TaxID=1095631 RepID=H0GW75_SACCK|nr:YIL110W-like protein [Saccharomyces cerevisiae x Saccharomyces kudriavzevii VIN7]CAI4064485.1 hypothetical protein SKDZ_09G0610 [Saccharomyces kudriavzevii ZP591]